MKPQKWFPALDADELRERIDDAWIFAEKCFPFPRWELTCPACDAEEIQLSRMNFVRRGPPATLPYRCDVSFKCTLCSLFWTHGVPINEEQYGRATIEGTTRWRWRDLRERLLGAWHE